VPAERPRLRVVGYVVAWLLAASLAVAVGTFAVAGVGASVRDRGPLGSDTQVVRDAELREGSSTPDASAVPRTDRFEGDFGTFQVECRGAVAIGVSTDPAPGWRTVSYEQGPDDDVDAVFASGARSIELEVFCNGGVPTIADREEKTLPGDD